MLELQSHLVLEGSQPLLKDEICKTILKKRPSSSKGLGWDPKPKSKKSFAFAFASSSNIYDHQVHMIEVSKLKVNFENANHMIGAQ